MFKLPHLSLCVIMGITVIAVSHLFVETTHGVNANPSPYFIKQDNSQVLTNMTVGEQTSPSTSAFGDIEIKVPDKLIQAAQDDLTGHKQYFLSQVYKNGTDVIAKDMVLYDDWLALAVEKNHVPALHERAQVLRDTFDYSMQEEALSLFARAAKKGHGASQYELALAYYDGDVLDQDYQAAYYWYSKASEKGMPEAAYAMGLMHQLGKGVPVNQVKAMSLFAKASEQDHSEAQYLLALGYMSGVGVERDYEAARMLFRKSMHGGNVDAWKALRNINVT